MAFPPLQSIPITLEECPRGPALPTPASRLWSWRKSSISTGTWLGAGGWRLRTPCVCQSARSRSGFRTGGWSGRKSTSFPTPRSALPARPRPQPRGPSSSSSSRSKQASRWSPRRARQVYSAWMNPIQQKTQSRLRWQISQVEFDGPILSILHMVLSLSPCLCHWAPVTSFVPFLLCGRPRPLHISLKFTFNCHDGNRSVYIFVYY